MFTHFSFLLKVKKFIIDAILNMLLLLLVVQKCESTINYDPY